MKFVVTLVLETVNDTWTKEELMEELNGSVYKHQFKVITDGFVFNASQATVYGGF